MVANLLGAVGLGAASGLNAWIPLLALGVAQRVGFVQLSAPFDELGSTPVLAVLAVVFLVDLVGDKVPAIDHVLHAVGALVAPASGAVVVMAQENLLTEVHPLVAAGLGLVARSTPAGAPCGRWSPRGPVASGIRSCRSSRTSRRSS